MRRRGVRLCTITPLSHHGARHAHTQVLTPFGTAYTTNQTSLEYASGGPIQCQKYLKVITGSLQGACDIHDACRTVLLIEERPILLQPRKLRYSAHPLQSTDYQYLRTFTSLFVFHEGRMAMPYIRSCTRIFFLLQIKQTSAS